ASTEKGERTCKWKSTIWASPAHRRGASIARTAMRIIASSTIATEMGLGPRLAPHIRACRDGDWVVFLDLKRDRYSALPYRLEDAETWRALGVCATDDVSGARCSTSLIEVLQRQDYLAG